MFSFFTILILSYIIGSIPTAIIVSKIIMKDDIRNHGSGNAGATNVYRVMGWKPALFVVLVDMGKGTAATLLISRIGWEQLPLDQTVTQILAGAFAIIGHIWTVFAGFRGGKGVGTSFGVLLGLAPVAFLVSGVVWLILVFTTRMVSVGSIAAGIVFPVSIFFQRCFFDQGVPESIFLLSILVSLLIIITHRSNIRRLFRGEENRFGSGGKIVQEKI